MERNTLVIDHRIGSASDAVDDLELTFTIRLWKLDARYGYTFIMNHELGRLRRVKSRNV